MDDPSSISINITAPKKISKYLEEFRELASIVACKEYSLWLKKKVKKNKNQKILSIRIIANKTIQTFNKRYLGIDSATDVIAFSYLEEMDTLIVDTIGDIIISHEMAMNSCRSFKNSFKKELSLYIIHGVLHVFGYDDITASKKAKMWKRQDYYTKKYFEDCDEV
ncbi:MAG: rRNA maturation RNase YbeY [Candidatus Aureabacteria bacterium]|nr:rRNA maturation RNase YbeY [Candidatus Auribacterota bacterium]